MHPSSPRFVLVGLFIAAAAYGHATMASAADCPGGSLDATECIRQVKMAERELELLYSRMERHLTESYPDAHYGGAGDTSFAQQAIAAFRRSNNAWVQYRNAECWYEALEDGMSLNYANVVAAACELEVTRERLEQLKKRLTNHSTGLPQEAR